MKYRVEYSKKALKALKKMDKNTSQILVAGLEKTLIEQRVLEKSGKI